MEVPPATPPKWQPAFVIMSEGPKQENETKPEGQGENLNQNSIKAPALEALNF